MAPPEEIRNLKGPLVLGLRAKLLFGFGGLLLIMLTVSLLSETVMDHYGRAIQRSFREDYDSVAVCQRIKETVEQLDLEAQHIAWGGRVNPGVVEGLTGQIDRDLAAQRRDATLPGESAATENLAACWDDYRREYSRLPPPGNSATELRNFYPLSLLPKSLALRGAAQNLIEMNMKGVLSVPTNAQAVTSRSHWLMRSLTISGIALSLLFAALIGRIILRPVRTLTESVRQVERGNLDLNVPVQSGDELGSLAAAFNAMAARLRAYRQTDRERLERTERTTQLAIDSLPDAVLVINPHGKIELANDMAHRLFRIGPGDHVHTAGEEWLIALWREIGDSGHTSEPSGYESALQFEFDGEQRYLLPRTVPIADTNGKPIGATVVLADVTGLRRLDEMKNGLLSLVSHELKTPLTSARMVLHLVTEQKVGSLTEKQLELLSAARDDTDRLHQIVENLLDMSRIESGRALMELQPIAPADLLSKSLDSLAGMFQGQQVRLGVDVDSSLPNVMADAVRIGHVFANLLMNSLRHTPPGGTVSVGARSGGEWVEFTIHDSGPGVPRQYLHRLFEKFFRVPEEGGNGSGLGLALAKDIVEAHGGRIRAESGEGKGLIVAFTLPRATGAAGDPALGEKIAG